MPDNVALGDMEKPDSTGWTSGVDYRHYGSQEDQSPLGMGDKHRFTFYARIVSLNPETEYEARTYVGMNMNLGVPTDRIHCTGT